MATIEFSKQEKEQIVSKIQRYFNDELDQDLGQFDAEFLLDFFSEQIGPRYYNQGLSDARMVLASKLDEVDDAIYEIEKPADFSR